MRTRKVIVTESRDHNRMIIHNANVIFCSWHWSKAGRSSPYEPQLWWMFRPSGIWTTAPRKRVAEALFHGDLRNVESVTSDANPKYVRSSCVCIIPILSNKLHLPPFRLYSESLNILLWCHLHHCREKVTAGRCNVLLGSDVNSWVYVVDGYQTRVFWEHLKRNHSENFAKSERIGVIEDCFKIFSLTECQHSSNNSSTKTWWKRLAGTDVSKAKNVLVVSRHSGLFSILLPRQVVWLRWWLSELVEER